jgi:hypothetical protein
MVPHHIVEQARLESSRGTNGGALSGDDGEFTSDFKRLMERQPVSSGKLPKGMPL